MERLKLGIYATAMNARIMNAYEEIEDEDLANLLTVKDVVDYIISKKED